MSSRMEKRFAQLKAAGRSGLVTFVSAGDPDLKTSLEILKGMPGAGADFMEVGMPFSDPMADGPTIQAGSQRALKAGASVKKTLEMCKAFRQEDDDTPLILMGYYNPLYIYGVNAFAKDAAEAGVDGLIIVDLPPEEADELLTPAKSNGLNLVYLTAPTTDDARLPVVLKHASGFVYYVSITGVTGTKSADMAQVQESVERLRRHTDLPIAVGFGIKTPAQAAQTAAIADAVVVGSALVDKIAENLDTNGSAGPGLVNAVLGLVQELSDGVRNA